MFNKEHIVEAVAWGATGVAAIVAIIVTKSAWPLLAFCIPYCIPSMRKLTEEKGRK